MAPKKPPEPKPPVYKPEIAVKHLRDVAAQLREAAKGNSISESDSGVLHLALEDVVTKALGENHPQIYSIVGASVHNVIGYHTSDAEYARQRADDANHQAKLVDQLIKRFEADLAANPPPSAPVAKGPTPLQRVEHKLSRFHRVALQLRKRHGNRKTIEIADEYDVQDLLHALLKIDFQDIRPEEYTPSYAGAASRMDFLLKQEQLVVEVKMTRDGLDGKEVGSQLLIDIGRYQAHPDCKTLVCFVYDPTTRIDNPAGLEHDLSRTEGNLTVKVIVAPKH